MVSLDERSRRRTAILTTTLLWCALGCGDDGAADRDGGGGGGTDGGVTRDAAGDSGSSGDAGSGVTPTDFGHTWGGPERDGMLAVAVDPVGNVYAVGSTRSFGAGEGDVVVLKYDAAGELLWARTWGGDGADFGGALAVAPDGGVYVAGSTSSFSESVELLVLAYDATGALEWAKTWDTSASAGASARAIAVGADGSLYVAGSAYFGSNDPECEPTCMNALVAKLDATGALVWSRTAVARSGSRANSMAIGPDGRIHLAGLAYNSSSLNSYAYWVFDDSGTLLHDVFDAPASCDGKDAFVAVDAEGAAYLAVHAEATATGNTEIFVRKVDSAAEGVWSNSWVGSESYEIDAPTGIAVGPDGRVYVAGTTESFGAGYKDILLVAFDAAGAGLGAKTWGGPEDEEAAAVTVRPDGRVLVVGRSIGLGGPWQDAPDLFRSWTPELESDPGTGSTDDPMLTARTPEGTEGTPAATMDEPAGDFDAILLQHELSF